MSEEPPTRERLLEIVDMIRSDCENDAQKIDRTPFTGRGIGERFGETLALIHGLAGVVEAMAKALPPGEVTPSFDNQTPTRGDAQGWVDRSRPVAADRRAPAAPKQVPVSPPTKGKTPGAEPRLGTGDHPYRDPGDGRQQCRICGKYVFPVTHSCKGIRVAPTDGGPSFIPTAAPAASPGDLGAEQAAEMEAGDD